MSKKNPRGPTTRQLRMGELVRRTLAEVLQRGEIHDPELNALPITVSEARPSPDLRVVTVYVMPLAGEHREEAIRLLARNAHELTRILFRRLDVKYPPQLRFRIDESFDVLDRTRALFESEAVRRDLEDGSERQERGKDGGRGDPFRD